MNKPTKTRRKFITHPSKSIAHEKSINIHRKYIQIREHLLKSIEHPSESIENPSESTEKSIEHQNPSASIETRFFTSFFHHLNPPFFPSIKTITGKCTQIFQVS